MFINYSGFRQFLEDQGYLSNTNEAFKEFLVDQGYTGQLNEATFKFLTNLGYTQKTLPEKMKEWSDNDFILSNAPTITLLPVVSPASWIEDTAESMSAGTATDDGGGTVSYQFRWLSGVVEGEGSIVDSDSSYTPDGTDVSNIVTAQWRANVTGGANDGGSTGWVTIDSGTIAPSVEITATVTPAMSALYEGQSIDDVTNYATMVSLGNFSSTGGSIVSAVVSPTGAPSTVSEALNESDSAGFTVTVTDDDVPANVKVFTATAITTQYKQRVISSSGNEAQIEINPLVPGTENVTFTISGTSYDGDYTKTADEWNAGAVNVGAAGLPSISGTADVGEVQTADDGLWTVPTSSLTLTRQWQRDDSDISSETGTTYTTVGADAGTDLTVEVTGDDGTNPTSMAESAAQSISGSFDSTDLFGSSENGILWESARSTMWQDETDTDLADANSDDVALIESRVNNPNDGTGSANKVTLQGVGTAPYIVFSATGSRFLQLRDTISVDPMAAFSMVMGVKSGQSGHAIMALNRNATASGTFLRIRVQSDGTIDWADDSTNRTMTATINTANDYIICVRTRSGVSTVTGSDDFEILPDSTTTEQFADSGTTAAYVDNDWSWGRYRTIYSDMDSVGFCVIDRRITDTEFTDLQTLWKGDM